MKNFKRIRSLDSFLPKAQRAYEEAKKAPAGALQNSIWNEENRLRKGPGFFLVGGGGGGRKMGAVKPGRFLMVFNFCIFLRSRPLEFESILVLEDSAAQV